MLYLSSSDETIIPNPYFLLNVAVRLVEVLLILALLINSWTAPHCCSAFPIAISMTDREACCWTFPWLNEIDISEISIGHFLSFFL